MLGRVVLAALLFATSAGAATSGIDGTKVLKRGDTMTGSLRIESSTLTVTGPIISTGTNGGVVFSGAGTRFEWIPSSAALRAGSVTGAQWDGVSIGPGSLAFGINNTASAIGSLALSGTGNSATGAYSGIFSGGNNSAREAFSLIGSGNSNQILHYEGFIGSGEGNYVGGGGFDAELGQGFIGSGIANVCSGYNCFIGNGGANSATGNLAAIVGGGFDNVFITGAGNTATGDWCIIGNGYSNNCSNLASGVFSGIENDASGPLANIAGGATGSALGSYSGIPMGQLNYVSGDWSMAAGYRATVLRKGSFAWSDSRGSFTSDIDDSFQIKAGGGFLARASSHTFESEGGVPLLTVDGTSVAVRGNSFNVGGSSFSVGGGSATVVYRMTAGSFSGDGANLTNVPATFTGGTVANQTTFLSTVTIQGNEFSVGSSTFIISGGTATFGARVNFSSAAVFLPLAYSTNTIGQAAIWFDSTTKRLSAYENGFSTRPILATPSDWTYTYRTGTASAACAIATIQTSDVICQFGEAMGVMGCQTGGGGGSAMTINGGPISTTTWRCYMDCVTAAGTEKVTASGTCVKGPP